MPRKTKQDDITSPRKIENPAMQQIRKRLYGKMMIWICYLIIGLYWVNINCSETICASFITRNVLNYALRKRAQYGIVIV